MSASRKTTGRPTQSAPTRVAIAPAAEPHPLGPLRPVVRRWPVVALITVLFAAAAVAAGLAQSPTYTATSDVSVGRVDVRVQSLPGYVAGAQALAAAYSRVMVSDVIVTPLARRLGLSPAVVRRRVSATPVPDATSFRIFGAGDSAAEAIRITRAATQQMKAYVSATDNGQRAQDAALRDYREQARISADLRRRIERLREQQDAADRAVAAAATPLPPSAARERARARRASEIARLQVPLDTAQLKMQSLGGRYQERASELASSAGVQVITSPVAATSDRNRTLQRLLSVGLVAGVLLGAALALLIDRHRAGAVSRRA